MRVVYLKPGRQVMCEGRVYTFCTRLRRNHEICGRTVNIFQCDDFRGLNGPDDDGKVHLTDHEVNAKCTPK